MKNKTDDTLMALQIQLAHLEHTIDVLNDTVTAQTLDIQTLQAQLKLLYRYLQARHQDEGFIEPFDLLADRPPHY